jgi:Uma2 family endonuclease
MTGLRKQDLYVTPEDYLAAERISETKHEYLAGVIYAVASGSRGYNQIARNILTELALQLRGKKCEPFGSDMRLRINNAGARYYYYPDVTVDCSASTKDEVDQPSVIFEVLAPDTERYDRGEKLLNYQTIPTVAAVVLVDQFRAVITTYRRGAEGSWDMEFIGDLEETLELPEIGCSLPLRRIYERVMPVMPA